MATDFHARVREILDAALNHRTRSRDLFVERAAGGAAAVASEVRSLLPFYRAVDSLVSSGTDASDPWQPRITAFERSADGEAEDWRPPFSVAPYRAVELVGRGGMGSVYRAVHSMTGREVAIKLLSTRLLATRAQAGFKREEELLRHLRHPGIVRLRYAGVVRGFARRVEGERTEPETRPYLVMDYVRGESLTRYAERCRLGIIPRLALLVDVCEAVDYAHRNGIIHRDLKPDNILVTEGGRCCVLDFGIARVQALADFGHERAAGFTCTPAYASPEQFSGAPAATPESDVFSLGVIACELLTGVLPRRTPSGSVLDMKLRFEDSYLSEAERPRLHFSLEAILSIAMRRSRTRRYRTAGEFGRELNRVVQQFSPRSIWRRMFGMLTCFSRAPIDR